MKSYGAPGITLKSIQLKIFYGAPLEQKQWLSQWRCDKRKTEEGKARRAQCKVFKWQRKAD